MDVRDTWGEPGENMEFADEPDKETRAAILRHNSEDIVVYQAAQQHHRLQLKALEYRESNHDF